MSRAANRVRCYECGRLGPRDAGACGRCGAMLRALCGCGRDLSVYDEECGACRAPHVPARVPSGKLPAVRVAKWSALVLAVSVLAWRTLGRERVPSWKLKRQAVDAYHAGDWESAWQASRLVTIEAPADAKGWFLLAKSSQRLKHDPATYIALAEKAIALAPADAPARTFLAWAELQRGHLDRAIDHAQAAARAPSAPGSAWLLVAKLEMKKPRPSLVRVDDYLEKARAGGIDSTEVDVVLAEVSIRLHGVAGGADRLPPRTAATLNRALASIDASPGGMAAGASTSLSRARILLALGRVDEAFAEAMHALDQVPAGSPPQASAEARLVRAMALHARGSATAATSEFAETLRDRPDVATAACVSSYLTTAGDPGAARALLARAADSNDPTGALHAILASALIEQDVDEAGRAIESARALSRDDPFFAEIEGVVRTMQRRYADARSAYGDAIRIAPRLVGPRVRLALLAIEETRSTPAESHARAHAVADLERLGAQEDFRDDPFLLSGLGRLRLAAGDVAGAIQALEQAALQSPADADVWKALADARSRSTEPSALEDAAAAWGRARRLAPDDLATMLSEADAWFRAGRPEVAIATCTQYLGRHPDAASALRTRAGRYADIGMWSLAAADLARLKENRTDADTVALVDALGRAGDGIAAQRVAAQADRTASPPTRQALAVVTAINAGDISAAIDRLAAQGPSLPLAELQFETGRGEDCTRTLRALWRERPGDGRQARLLVTMLLGKEPVPAAALDEAKAVAGGLDAATPPELRSLVEGRVLLAENDLAGAGTKLTAAARALPGDALAQLFVGETLFRAGDRTASLVALRRAAAAPSKPFTVVQLVALRLLRASIETTDAERAESLAIESHRLDIKAAAAALRICELLHARGEYAQAAEVAQRQLTAADTAPEESVRLRLAAALEYVWAGNAAAAMAHIDALAPQVRAAAAARLITAYAQIGARQFDEAEELLRAVLTADPGNAASAFGLAMIALERGDRITALARADAWCAAHPHDRDLPLAMSRLLLRDGLDDDALRFAQRYVAGHPRDADALLHAVRALRHGGKPAEAVASARRFAASAAPDQAAAARLLALGLAVECGIDVASSLAAARTIAEDPATPAAACLLAESIEADALVALGRIEEAETAANSLLRTVAAVPVRGRPERIAEVRARYVLGVCAASATPPRGPQAAEELMRSFELDPARSLDTQNNLAWVLAQDPPTAQRALDLARRVTAADPANAYYWDTRAEAARRVGDAEDANSSWAKCMDLFETAKGEGRLRQVRIALRYATFLRERNEIDAARTVAMRARRWAQGTDAARDLDRFLGK